MGFLFDPVFVAVMFAVVVAFATAGPAMAAYQQDRLRRQRIAAYVRRNGDGDAKAARDGAKRKQINNKLKALAESKRHGKTRLDAVRGLIIRAGLEMPLSQFWMACMGCGFAASMLWLLAFSEPTLAPGVFLVATFVLPRTVLKIMAGRRQKEFTKHFSDAVDVLVRGLKSGLPVGECFRIIARESPDPVGSEFRIVMDEVNAGLTMEEALERAYDRMPTQELRFFATVISVQQQTGGNLAEILSNISNVLRGRAQLREKVKALSGEARASSMIIGSLPFIIGGILYFINHSYISILWTTRSGKMLLAFAACLMTFGIWLMNKMGQLDN